jgi:hypothetical protein
LFPGGERQRPLSAWVVVAGAGLVLDPVLDGILPQVLRLGSEAEQLRQTARSASVRQRLSTSI